MCNMYLQDRRPGRTPRWRGVAPLHELKAAGVPVAVASDNTRDPFYAYGDLDMLEVLREATRILHLDHPGRDWPRAVTATPADVMGLDRHGRIEAGDAADLVLLRARSLTELLARPQADRTVLVAGRGDRHDPARLSRTRPIDAPVAGRSGTCSVTARYDIAAPEGPPRRHHASRTTRRSCARRAATSTGTRRS